MLRITIGLINYSGVACGVNFEKSIGQNIPEDWTVEQPQVKRLLALFPGTTVEHVGVGKAVESEEETKSKPTPQPEGESKKSEAQEVVEEVETAPVAEPVEEEDEEVAEDVEEVEEPEEDDENKPLAAGDDVLANYKEEFRKGKVVAVLESGVVRVKIDGDDANYRVLDDDKVSRLDVSETE